MKIRAIIVDDESLARDRVRLLLRNEPDIEVIAECSNGPDAIQCIRRETPDLVFLDVQMPEVDGFAVLEALDPARLPVVIFVTAYDQHALRAFDAHALDYLLKPFKPARFKEAVQRARETVEGKRAGTSARDLLDLLTRREAKPAHVHRLPIRSGDRVVFLKTSDIESIESAGNYVVVHSGKEQHILRETLTSLESQLAPDQFLRISRGALVNVDKIKELQPLFKGEHAVILTGGRQLTMTRGLREVEKHLKFSQ